MVNLKYNKQLIIDNINYLIKYNNDNKYCDQVFNDYIKECSILIERNNVVI